LTHVGEAAGELAAMLVKLRHDAALLQMVRRKRRQFSGRILQVLSGRRDRRWIQGARQVVQSADQGADAVDGLRQDFAGAQKFEFDNSARSFHLLKQFCVAAGLS
jgi:hypothetical protein